MKSSLCKILIIVIFGIFCSLNSHAQDLSTQSKKAAKLFNEGEGLFRLQDYVRAENKFKEAIEIDPEFFEAWVMIAELFERTKRDSNAIVAYNRAIQIDSTIYPSAWLYLGELEYENGLYSEAKSHLSDYLSKKTGNPENTSKAEKHIQNCDFALEAMKHPVPFKPINAGPEVNTSLNEYFPCLTADNEVLLFTRLLKDTNSFTGKQEDFYTSKKINDGWSTAVNIGLPINTMYNEGAPTLSADGNMLLFTACESVNGYGAKRSGFGRCDLFIASKNGDRWNAPFNAGAPVNSKNWESQPSLSADGRTLYFVSNRDKNYDIFVSSMDETGEWTIPEKLGENINTDGYEGSVFIHPDNQSLYFSSDGRLGMGGMDIFISRKDSTGQWGKPVNLGYPINTWKDENSIVISADGELAMFASDRKEGYGGLDLYTFELYPEARPQFVTYVKGSVFDATSKKPLKARFELTNLQNGEIAVTSYSNSGNGEFLVCLPTDHDYALSVSLDGYLFYSENFNLSGVHSSVDPFLKDIPLKPVKVGERVVMNNIFFQTDQYELLETSRFELRKLLDFLDRNPDIKIEIGGFTDNVGSPEYNLELSKNRAKAVNDYLISKGVDQARIKYIGYGETHPVDTNNTEQGRANNRRTEFKVSDW